MKLLIDGVWYSIPPDTLKSPTAASRKFSLPFCNYVTADGSSGFKAESDRYHLYVSYACPWAHRTILLRKLKKLEDVISMSVLDPDWGSPNGWVFTNRPDCTPDIVNGCEYLHQVYTLAKPDYTGKVTVPVLWDKRLRTIVNNESADIIRMLNSEFDAFGDASVDFYQQTLRAEIDRMNAFVLEEVNAGVYRAGFASSQAAYDLAVDSLFDALDSLNEHLHHNRYLVGNRLTEADLRLFVTLVRFDVVYYGALNCNLRRLVDYPNLWEYTRRIYHISGVTETVKLDHIKRHYYDTYEGTINRRIVPKGPLIDFGSSPDPETQLADIHYSNSN
jgi:putative glutathione S-transferase